MVAFKPFIRRRELFAALGVPAYFVLEMRMLRGGIGPAQPEDLDFSADGLRHAAFPDEAVSEYSEQASAAD